MEKEEAMETMDTRDTREKDNFFYITIATKPHPILDNIKNRVESQSESITILGEQENRSIGWQSKGNFGIKLKEVYEFLGRMDLQDNDIVLFTDAYDVIYCGNREQIIKRFLKFNKPIVFGGEKFCNPDPSRVSEYSDVLNREFPFLNSGLFIGRVWALRICMMDYVFDDMHDDQRFWTDRFFQYSDLITLDYDHTIFLNTVGIPVNEILWNGRHCIYKGRNPQFIHVNGPDKSDLSVFFPR